MAEHTLKFSILVFSLVSLAPWFLEANKQMFQPMKVWSLFQVGLVSPAALILGSNPELFHSSLTYYMSSSTSDALARTIYIYALLNLCIVISYYLVLGRVRARKTISRTSVVIRGADRLDYAFIFLGFGLFLFFIKLQSIGGLSFLLNHTSNRVSLQAGLGPLSMLQDAALLISNAIVIKLCAVKPSLKRIFCLAVIVLTTVYIGSVFGGRKASLQLMIMTLMLLCIFRPDVMKFNLNTILLLFGLSLIGVIYFYAVLVYRDTGDLSEFVLKFPSLMAEIGDEFSNIFVSLSYLDTYTFITEAFDENNYYWGSTFTDLKTSFLPSALVPDKPAVDDGVFVRSLTLGYYLEPGTPAYTITHNSWPPETLGAGYMNGGLLGVMISGVILGTIFASIYRFATKRVNSIFWMVILTHVFLNFEISNLRIVNLVTTVVGVGIVYWGVRIPLYMISGESLNE